MNNHIESKIRSFDGMEIFYAKDMVESPRAVVLIVHGLCEHLGRYDYLTNKLNSFQYTVYRFDNRGHGRSGGERGYLEKFSDFLEDANAIVDLAKEENKKCPIFMLGHSMGGLITAAYGIKYKNKLNGQMLSGAALLELPIFEDLKKDNHFEKYPLVLKETNIKLLGEAFINGAA